MDQQSPIVALISAIIAGVVSYVTAKKHDTSSYVKDQKILWQSKIRHIAKDLYLASYKKTLKLLSELKTYINPIGHNEGFTHAFFSDAHIWDLIDEMESTDFSDSKKLLHLKQNQLIEYLSLLLKYDWENSKGSTFYNINSICGFLLLLASAIAYTVPYLSNKRVFAALALFVILTDYFTWLVFLTWKCILDLFLKEENFEKHPNLLQNASLLKLAFIISGGVIIILWFSLYDVCISTILSTCGLSVDNIAPGLASYFIGFGLFCIGILKQYFFRYAHIYTVYKIKNRYKTLPTTNKGACCRKNITFSWFKRIIFIKFLIILIYLIVQKR